MVNYPYYTDLGRLPIIWAEQIDEWRYRLGHSLAELDSTLTLSLHFGADTSPFYRFSARRGHERLSGDLLMAPTVPGDEVCLIIGWRADAAEADLSIWQIATTEAFKRMGAENPMHGWSAIIGPPPMRIGGTEVHISNEVRIDSFHLKPANRPLCEVASPPVPVPSLNSATYLASLPIIVRGQNSGYSWESASLSAARDLNILCYILSVMWSTPMVIRESPAPIDWGERQVPETIYWQKAQADEPSKWQPRPDREKTLPLWATRAWQETKTKPWLMNALAAHHEGLRLQVEHSSIALVAHVACIEAISQRLFLEERCKECSTHQNVTAKFRAALRLVVPNDEATRLGDAYKPRSFTVHQGRLHGSENTRGAMSFGVGRLTRDDFEWQTVWTMARAARNLLEMALKGSLPNKAPLPKELKATEAPLAA